MTRRRDRLLGHERTAFAAVLYRLFAEILCARLRGMDERILALQGANVRLRRELGQSLEREDR